jgi:hypothetical protein
MWRPCCIYLDCNISSHLNILGGVTLNDLSHRSSMVSHLLRRILYPLPMCACQILSVILFLYHTLNRYQLRRFTCYTHVSSQNCFTWLSSAGFPFQLFLPQVEMRHKPCVPILPFTTIVNGVDFTIPAIQVNILPDQIFRLSKLI